MIPSLLQIPSAVSDSKLHSVLPNNGKGDFTFDRSTGATRINKDGLIEEVGYFSSELVQNGNFSELGSELVTNGDFATDSNWAKGSGWTINNGKASVNTTTINVALTQDGIITVGKTYKVIYEVKDFVAGSIRVRLGDTWGSYRTANGTYTEYLVATTNTDFRFYATAATTELSIDNVSVKQVDPNDRWNLATGYSITDKISYDGSASGYSSSYQIVGSELGKKYSVKFDCIVTSGSVQFKMGSINADSAGQNITVSSTGSYSVELTAGGTQGNRVYIVANAGNFVGSFDNISVKEIKGDRPRLSYDITNGVVEDKPHLLLEPSSTNLCTHSVDFATGVSSGSLNLGVNSTLTYVSNIQAPDGTMGVYRLQNPAQSGTYLSFYNGNSKNVSVYVKAVDVNNNNQFTLFKSGGSPYSSSVFTATSNWQRYNFEYAQSGNITGINNEGDTYASDVYIWGAQVEDANSYATSLIPTAGTTITRAAETCNNSKPSINSTEGVLYAEIASLTTDASGATRLSVNDGSQDNNVTIGYSASNTVRTIIRSSASNQN